MDLRIVPFDAKTASREEWRQFHAWRRLRREETDPGEPMLSDASIERLLRRDHPEWQEFRFAAMDPERPDAIIGFVWFETSRPGGASHETNKHIAFVIVELLRPYRRRGYGRAMLRKVVEFAHEHGRTVLQGWCEEPDGKAFAKAIGLRVVSPRRVNRLNLDHVDWAMVERWRREGPERSPGTTLRWYRNRIDDDILETYCKAFTEVFNQQPFDEATRGEFVFTPEVFRNREEAIAETGATWITVMSVEKDGDISGLTEMTFNPDMQWIMWQGMTGVRDTYRGRGLGKWIKAEMLLRARREFPNVRVVETGNASSNAAMLSINERLGFRTHKEAWSVEMTRDALEAYLNA